MQQMAAYTGAAEVIIFGRDAEIGMLLPAMGLPQTLRHAAMWHGFLQQCIEHRECCIRLPSPTTGLETTAFGMADDTDRCVIAFFDARPDDSQRAQIAALLPLLSGKLEMERAMHAAASHVKTAHEATRVAGALNTALENSRQEAQRAFRLAELELKHRREAEKKLKEADRRKDEFLAMLSHELRNPLAPIRMAAELLRMPGLPPGKSANACAIIERQLRHMTGLLDDLLNVSRVTSGMICLQREIIDLREAVVEAVEQTQSSIESRQHRLHLETGSHPVWINADKTRIVQIIANLLINAAKYTPTGGDITLMLTMAADRVNLIVKDNGIGMDAALISQVFDLFTQAERSLDRVEGGLGIGLTLIRKLVSLHDGTVSASSDGPGCGSEFVVTLPMLKHPPHDQSVSEKSPRQQLPRNAWSIMIVDDNVDAAQMLASLLERFNCRTIVAHNARDALALARTHAVGAFVLDIGLPDIDGYTLATLLRELPGNAKRPFIALTGYGRVSDRDKALEAGFAVHLTKPADAQAILDVLATNPD